MFVTHVFLWFQSIMLITKILDALDTVAGKSGMLALVGGVVSRKSSPYIIVLTEWLDLFCLSFVRFPHFTCIGLHFAATRLSC